MLSSLVQTAGSDSEVLPVACRPKIAMEPCLCCVRAIVIIVQFSLAVSRKSSLYNWCFVDSLSWHVPYTSSHCRRGYVLRLSWVGGVTGVCPLAGLHEKFSNDF